MSVTPFTTLAASLALTAPLVAQSSTVWSLRGEQLLEAFPSTDTAGVGFAVDGGLDVDGDSIPDVVMGAPLAQVGEVAGTGGVIVVSGADGSLIHRISGTAEGDRFGSAVALMPDVNGDGLAEIAVGAPTDDPTRPVDEVFVTVHSGADGSELWRATAFDPFANEGFEQTPGAFPAGAWQMDGPGSSFIVSTVADASMPSHGAGYLVLSAEGSNGALPPSVTTPGFGDPPSGTVALHQTFQLEPGRTQLDVDYVFLSAEGSAPTFYDDFVCVVVSAGNQHYIAAYASVNSSTYDENNTSTQFDGLPTTALMSLSVDLAPLFPDATAATAFEVAVHIGNFDDSASSSVAYIDRLELGAATGFAGTPPSLEAGSFGACVTSVGDMDGDGVADLFVGAPLAKDNLSSAPAGRGNIFSGVDGSLLRSLALGAEGAGFGGSAASAGDVDGDGVDDLLVGETGDVAQPQLHVFSGLDGSALEVTTSGLAHAVSGGADLNGDGILDRVTGNNAVVIATSWDGTAVGGWVATGADDSYGRSLAIVGDVNADGFPDVAIGNRLAIVAPPGPVFSDFIDAGQVELHSGVDGDLLFRVEGDEKFAFLGQSLAAAGDVNLDGYADFVLGSPELDPLFSELNGPGSADVIFGGDPWFFRPGDRFAERVEDGELDCYEFVANQGTKFSAQVKTAKGSSLVPRFRVVGPLPSEAVIVSQAESASKDTLAQVKNVPIIEPGTYRMEVFPEDGSGGAYELKTKGKYGKGKSKVGGLAPGVDVTLVLGDKPTGAIPEEGGSIKHVFHGAAGAVVTIRAKRASKNELLTPFLVLTGPQGQLLVAAEESVVNDGEARIDKFVLPHNGAYCLELGGVADTFGAFKLTTKGKFPKGKNKVAAPDPLPES